MGMDWMAEPMTKPSETGMTCVQPAPLSITVPVILPRALCRYVTCFVSHSYAGVRVTCGEVPESGQDNYLKTVRVGVEPG